MRALYEPIVDVHNLVPIQVQYLFPTFVGSFFFFFPIKCKQTLTPTFAVYLDAYTGRSCMRLLGWYVTAVRPSLIFGRAMSEDEFYFVMTELRANLTKFKLHLCAKIMYKLYAFCIRGSAR